MYLHKLHYNLIKTLDLLSLKKVITDPQGILPFENKTKNERDKATKEIDEQTLKEIDNIIDKVDPKKQDSIDKGIKQINNSLDDYSKKITPISSDIIYDNSDNVYRKTGTALERELAIDYSFGQADEIAIARINKMQSTFIGDHYQDDVTKQADSIIRNTIAENKTLSREAIANELKAKMPNLVKQPGYFNVVVAQALNSSRSYSNMMFYSSAKILTFTVLAILDERTSVQCRFMDGKSLAVSTALSRFDLYDSAKTPDEVKAINPWLVDTKGIPTLGGKSLIGLSGSELQAMGINAPPYHANCRTTVVPNL